MVPGIDQVNSLGSGGLSLGKERFSGVACVSEQFFGRVALTMGSRMPARRGALSRLSRPRGIVGYAGAGSAAGSCMASSIVSAASHATFAIFLIK